MLRPATQAKKLLVATGNPGKLAEFSELLRDIPYQITSLQGEGISLEIEETGASYEENARLKAEACARASGLLTLADDSGLEVDALNGEPGPLSARYGGPGLSDTERVQLLLAKLVAVPDAQRTARFVCVIAVAEPAYRPKAGRGRSGRPGGASHLVRGECYGIIIREPRGSSGFGYDPVFLLPALGLTLAELSSAQKNTVSHRARAAQQARSVLVSLGGRR